MKTTFISKQTFSPFLGQKKLKNFLPMVFLFIFSLNLFAQESTTLKGKVVDDQNAPLPGVYIALKGAKGSTATDQHGNFSIPVNKAFPLTVTASLVGFQTQEIEIYENQKIEITLAQSVNRLDQVVVTASRKKESLSKVPVTVETLSAAQLKQSPSSSVYDLISTLKGVNTLNTSIAFTVYNTRGFQHPNNLRFVQLVDGADNSSPELGLPIGNTIGPGELDFQNAELIPGASSALYGLNATNGLLNLITKDPFTFQGLSISIKPGINNLGSPFKSVYDTKASFYNNIALRYAKAFNDKFAFKVNLGYIKGTDWASGDFNDYRDINSSGLNSRKDPGYDGANTYGDEGGLTNILITADGIPTKVSRTGYKEKDLTDYDSKLLHADATLAYKFSPNSNIYYTYRIGEMDGIFTRGNKLKFKNFVVQQHLLQLKLGDFSLKSYINTENSGDSYNIRYLADALNNAASTKAAWNTAFQTAFKTNYVAARTEGQTAAAARQTALDAARTTADASRIEPGTAAFDQKIAALRADGSWKTGAKFHATGHFWHNEANYDLTKYTRKIADVLVGADYRYSSVNSGGTFYADTAHSVYSYKYGGFLQLARDLNEQFRVVGSVRYDKARDIDGQFTDRLGLIFNLDKHNSFRLSYQNGYRLPTFVEAYTYVATGAGVGLGGLQPNLEPVGLVNNSYTYGSFLKFYSGVYNTIATKYLAGIAAGTITQAQAAGLAAVENKDLLQVSSIDYLKPEKNQTIDLSYKGSFLKDKLFVDVNAYGTQYDDFIQTFTILKPTGGISTTQADALKILSNSFTAYQVYTNLTSKVYVYGISLGADYNFYKKYVVSGNFNYVTFDSGNTSEDDLSNGFNTPKFNINLSIANPDVYKNVGFKVQYKYTSKIDWKTDFSIGEVPSWQTVDAQVSYRIPQQKATVALGGTNIFNKYYTQYIGGPSIGGFYYASLTFDGLFTK